MSASLQASTNTDLKLHEVMVPVEVAMKEFQGIVAEGVEGGEDEDE